ncbi:hypothetical protein B0T10DRAFT_461065 [Thelonectria olida]|uniref:Nucleoside phosphorylase domain-containing protein n=1 Tax=Thelonectria olida TaxID=1576542 RepID=A0A9P8W2C8_9HYPO|nr:hypothetical protein B0T10DRAFT_461065 [Thelonectria olida]
MDPRRPPRPRTRDDFEIAIICALTLEADAIIDLFDHHWDDEEPNYYGKARGDPNAYSVGVIGHHKVVLAHLSGMGKVAAGSIAAFCRMSFPNIKLALVVGVCGGAPFYSQRQIFLGDVVISDGVVQYDFGRRFPDKFEIKNTLDDSLGRPNLEIRTWLAKLKTARQIEKLEKAIRTHLHPSNQDSRRPNKYPGRSADYLFPADYRHKHQDSSICSQCASCQRRTDPVCEAAASLGCEELGCEANKHVARHVRDGDEEQLPCPAIHFGRVASGDTVMKSGEDRDDLTRDHKAIAFEMESAGVWDVFPCVVIKGVCDYADSHKNKDWQEYAAASAAACTKGFLSYWASTIQDLRAEDESRQRTERLLTSLKFPEMNARKNDISSNAPETFNWVLELEHSNDGEFSTESTESRMTSGTGEAIGTNNEGFFEVQRRQFDGKSESNASSAERIHSESESEGYSRDDSIPWNSFIDWLESDLPVYWIRGKPASGKSTLMKFIASHSKTKEMLEQWLPGARILTHYFWKPGAIMQQSMKGFLCSVLYQLLSEDDHFLYHGVHDLVKNFDRDSPSDWKRLFRLRLQQYPSLEIHELTRADMLKYATDTISTTTVGGPTGSELRDLVGSIVLQADGVFLWVVLVTRSLVRGIINGDSQEETYRRLEAMPQGLEGLYRDILIRSAEDRPIYYKAAAQILSIVIYCTEKWKHPLTVEELTAALDDTILDCYLHRGKKLPALTIVEKCQRTLKMMEVGCAGLLEGQGHKHVYASEDDSNGDVSLANQPLLPTCMDMDVRFLHRTAHDFLIDTEEGLSLWQTGGFSRQESLFRSFKGLMVMDDLYPTSEYNSSIGKIEHMRCMQHDVPLEMITNIMSIIQARFARCSTSPRPLLSVYFNRRTECLIWAANDALVGYVLDQLASYETPQVVEISLQALILISNSIWHYISDVFLAHPYIKEPKEEVLDELGRFHGWHQLIHHFLCLGVNPNAELREEQLTFNGEDVYGTGSGWLRYLLALLNWTFNRCPSDLILRTIGAFIEAGASFDSKVVFGVTWDYLLSEETSHIIMVPPSLLVEFTPSEIVFEANARALVEGVLHLLDAPIPPEMENHDCSVDPYMRVVYFKALGKPPGWSVASREVSTLLLSGLTARLRIRFLGRPREEVRELEKQIIEGWKMVILQASTSSGEHEGSPE